MGLITNRRKKDIEVGLIIAVIALGIGGLAFFVANGKSGPLNYSSNWLKSNCVFTNSGGGQTSIGMGVTITPKTTGKIIFESHIRATSSVAASLDEFAIFRTIGAIPTCGSSTVGSFKAIAYITSVLDNDGLTINPYTIDISGFDNTTIPTPVVKYVTYSYYLAGIDDSVSMDTITVIGGLNPSVTTTLQVQEIS